MSLVRSRRLRGIRPVKLFAPSCNRVRAGKFTELGRDWTRKVVIEDIQVLHAAEVTELGGDRARKVVGPEPQDPQVRQITELGRDRAGELVDL